MKAVRYRSYGDSGVLVYEDADRPVAGAGQVVVKVAGAAFNPVDVAIRAGFMQQVFPLAFPHIPNFDVAGVVAEAGEGVSGWSAGDAVVAFLPMTAPGAAAEYVAAPAEVLAAAPRTVELADAAALPSAGLTAWQSLFEHAGLKEGQSVLINGAGGAVGGYAVQLARQAGATVIATASARSAGRIRSYGADQIIDYTATTLLKAVAGRRFDVVLNLVRTSPEETAALADLAADGGVFVSTTTPGPTDPGRGVRTVRVFVRSDAGQLAGLVARVDAGDLKIDVAELRPLTDLPAVHDQAAAGRLAGKTVLNPLGGDMSKQQRDAIDAAMRAEPFDLSQSTAEHRKSFEALMVRPYPADVSPADVTLGGVSAIELAVAGHAAEPAVLYFHGGGYVAGSARTGTHLAAELARRTGGRALSVDYRLAPEHPYPAAVQDGLAAYAGLLESGASPSRVLVAGDSAGGGLAVATLVAAREQGLPQPAAIAVFSPWADISRSGSGMRTKDGADPLFSYDAMGWYAGRYVPAGDRSAPLASPVFAALAGLAPLLIQVGSHEVLLDDAIRLAANAGRDDVEVRLQVAPEGTHVFQFQFGALDEADEAIDEVARFFQRHLSYPQAGGVRC